LAALLHDAPEYVVGDMISPFKAALGLDYKAFEHRLLHAIHARFGLDPKTAAAWETEIKSADKVAAYLEATQLAGFPCRRLKNFLAVPVALMVLEQPNSFN
jgi:5'-deoxynucleotidase YfbR-like HD superfamily hydrolase